MALVAEPEVATDVDELNKLWEMPSYEEDSGWELMLYDDSHNTMEAVSIMLAQVFEMSIPKAVELMLRIHNHGKAGVFKGGYDECKEKQDELNVWQMIHNTDVMSSIEKVGD